MKNFMQELNNHLADRGSIKTCTALNGLLIGRHLIWDGDMLLSFDEEKKDIWKELLPKLELATPGQIIEIDEKQFFVEKLTSTPKLFIFGGGHIAVPLSQVGKLLGFEVTVIDDREEFVSKERFEKADHLIRAEFDQVFEQLPDYTNSYYVVLTPGHKKDLQCVNNILKRNYTYVGMIGSGTKVAKVRTSLLENGYSQEKLKELHAPIGLRIGGQTPAEIAVSIAAELVQERNKVPTSVIEEDIWESTLRESKLKESTLREGKLKESTLREGKLKESKLREGKLKESKLQESKLQESMLQESMLHECSPMILAEIIEKSGSSPRGSGSRMLVLENGTIRGTIGGGSVEFAAIQKGRSMLTSGEAFTVEDYILSDVEGATLGMVCGGYIKVMFERVASPDWR